MFQKIKSKKIKIALMSVADILNYGDSLFPFIATQEILKRIPNADFRYFTPTDCIIEDTRFYGYSKERLMEYSPDVILTIGGEVIHKYDQLIWSEMYKNIPQKVVANNPSDTFFDWINYENAFKAWFSVGVLNLGPEYPQINFDELKKLDYIGVRGILSKKNLENHLWTYNPNIDMVPDIGWIFPRYVNNYNQILKKISKKLNIDIRKNNYIIFNTNNTAVPEEKIEYIKNVFSNFYKKFKLKILLLPIISSYNDSEILLKFQNDKIILLPSTLSLKEKVALLCGTKFYIGSSLHSAITTMAMSKPAILFHNVQLTKFQDLFSHAMNIESLDYNWENLEYKLNMCQDFSSNYKRNKIIQNYVKFMQSMFDYKLDILCKKIKRINK